jgi:hypothetical protein
LFVKLAVVFIQRFFDNTFIRTALLYCLYSPPGSEVTIITLRMCVSYLWTCRYCATDQTFHIWCHTRRCVQPSYMGTMPIMYNPHCQNCANPRNGLPSTDGQQYGRNVDAAMLNRSFPTLAQPLDSIGFTPIDIIPTAGQPNLLPMGTPYHISDQQSPHRHPGQGLPLPTQPRTRGNLNSPPVIQDDFQVSAPPEVLRTEPQPVQQPVPDIEFQLEKMEKERDELLIRMERTTEHVEGTVHSQEGSDGRTLWEELLVNLRVVNRARRNRGMDGSGDSKGSDCGEHS